MVRLRLVRNTVLADRAAIAAHAMREHALVRVGASAAAVATDEPKSMVLPIAALGAVGAAFGGAMWGLVGLFGGALAGLGVGYGATRLAEKIKTGSAGSASSSDASQPTRPILTALESDTAGGSWSTGAAIRSSAGDKLEMKPRPKATSSTTVTETETPAPAATSSDLDAAKASGLAKGKLDGANDRKAGLARNPRSPDYYTPEWPMELKTAYSDAYIEGYDPEFSKP